jgi:hypothetical protein
MPPAGYSAQSLVTLLRRQRIATLPELMTALGTRTERTVFRKFQELTYRTSYSHRGRYYTLDEMAEFDEQGLWSFASVRFSAQGTLLDTACAFVGKARAGYFVDELDNRLGVGTKDALRKLAADERVARERFEGQYLYLSADGARSRQQIRIRRAEQAEPGAGGTLPSADVMPDELKAALLLFASALDEKTRRLYAGLEALKTGRGGDRRIADLLGLDPGTVARGRRELLERDIEIERVRRAGGGRKPVETKRPRSSPTSRR